MSIPKSVSEVLVHPGWDQTMLDEQSALQKCGTWKFVPLPSGKFVVRCRWIFVIKVSFGGNIDRLKA